MKKLLISLLAFSAVIIFSCSKDDNSLTCDVSPDTYVLTADATVTYSVTITGSVSVSTIKYQGTSGPVTLSNPTVPFSIVLPLASGLPSTIEAIGTTNGGTITAAYNVEYSPGNTQEDDETCGN